MYVMPSASFAYHCGTLVPAVLTVTSHSYGNGQNSPPQNPNPLTDHDKTLQNWFIMSKTLP